MRGNDERAAGGLADDAERDAASDLRKNPPAWRGRK